MPKDKVPQLAIGECSNCGQRYYGIWLLNEAHLEMICPTCVRRDPGANGKLVSMRIEPISSKKGGEW
jgi:hypothetical protein